MAEQNQQTLGVCVPSYFAWFSTTPNPLHTLCLWLFSLILCFAGGIGSSVAQANYCPYTPSNLAAPSCPIADDPSVTISRSAPLRHVGNPIDVITGDKYQHEIDYIALGSKLHFSRYYHSLDATTDNLLGQGWRHSYMVNLFAIDDGHMQVIQSDGRHIDFTRHTQADGTERFVAEASEDGYITAQKPFVWHTEDGRTLQFKGSYLTSIDYPDGEVLTLFYHKYRLKRVSDQAGRALLFSYAEGAKALEFYDPKSDIVLSGHLQFIELPNGEQVHYRYDGRRNLVSVVGSSGLQMRYGYDDAHFPNHLSSVTHVRAENQASGLSPSAVNRSANDDSSTADETADVEHKTWAYDAYGRAVRYTDELRERTITLEFSAGIETAPQGSTQVRSVDGTLQQFDWQRTEPTSEPYVYRIQSRDCEGCEVREKHFADPRLQQSDGVADDAEGSETRAKDQSQSNTPQAPIEGGFDLDSVQAANTQANAASNSGASNDTSDSQSQVPSLDAQHLASLFTQSTAGLGGAIPATQSGLSVDIQVSAERLGRVIDIRFGDTAYRDLLDDAAYGEMVQCGFSPIQAQELAANNDILDAYSNPQVVDPRVGADAGKSCFEDLLYLYDLIDQLQQQALRPQRMNRSGKSSDTGDSNCDENPFVSCDVLKRNYDMARLSACAYIQPGKAGYQQSCGSQWEWVPPDSLGLNASDFTKGSFAAVVFRNTETGEYVCSFRGSHDSGDYIGSFFQSGGAAVWQYRHAKSVARALEASSVVQGSELSFTGHSLGGGLATVAALSIGAQAEVFNPAALHPETARRLDLDYSLADSLVEVTTMQGDILTGLQASPNVEGYFQWHVAPGKHTQFGKPSKEWIEAQGWGGGDFFKPILLHKIKSILEKQRDLLSTECGYSDEELAEGVYD